MTTRRDFLKLIGATIVAATINPTGVVGAANISASELSKPKKVLSKTPISYKSGTWEGSLIRNRGVIKYGYDDGLSDFCEPYYSDGTWEQTASLSSTVSDMRLVQTIEDAFYKREKIRLEYGDFTLTGIITNYSVSSAYDDVSIHVKLAQVESVAE